MGCKNRRQKKRQAKKTNRILFFSSVFCVSLALTSFGVYHYVNANSDAAIHMHLDPNIGIEARVTEFFTANNAEEMIPIIKCESEFKHFNKDGTVLKNRRGSSATGVAQILASTHPDPKVLKRYNSRENTNLTPEDFDITTIEGNLGYALMLYELRGTRDWECAKKFRFK